MISAEEYAQALIKRADSIEPAFKGVPKTFVAWIVYEVEQDILKMLTENATYVDTFHSVGGGFVRSAADEIAKGFHRSSKIESHADAA